MMDKAPAVRPVEKKILDNIQSEWNRIAPLRHQHIASGKDLTFTHVSMPLIRRLLLDCSRDRVLDIGCGTGELTKEMASISGEVTGVDLSSVSIGIAQATCYGLNNTSFHSSPIEEFAERWKGPPFTTGVANMSLMDCINLESCLQASANLVAPWGCLIATITHPWFWPHYWGYADAEWFNYYQEVVLDAAFTISGETTECVTTHVHRPLSTYLQAFSKAGFVVDRILEPHPDEDIQVLYPTRWKYPRILAFLTHRVGNKDV